MRMLAGWLLILFVIACADRTKVPGDIIQKDKMEKIMWDMLQADKFVNNFILTGKDSLPAKKKQAAIFYDRVFQINGISRDQFLKSYKYYLGRPDITKIMFDSISGRAEMKRGEVHARRNPLLQKRDSLRRIDSIRRHDSADDADDENSTETMSDSALKKALFK